jgi:hypothetical protein
MSASGRCCRKIFFRVEYENFKTADAVRARRPEDPHRFIGKQPPAFVLAPEYLAAVAVPKKRLSRDFRCLSIFDFFDSIGQKRKWLGLNDMSASPLRADIVN